MRIYLRSCAVVATLIALGFLFPAIGLGQPTKVDGKGSTAPPPAPPKPQLKVKVYKLERADPEAVLLGLNSLLDEPDMDMPVPMPALGGIPIPPPMGILGVQGGLPAGIGGGLPGGAGFGGGIGFGGMGGMGGTVVPVWRATVDARTNAVIVRGSERHIKIAGDLVAILDRKENAPLPQLQIVKAFALKHADAADLVQVIDALAFEDIKLSNPEEKVLAVIGPDEVTKAVAEIVKELDVPAKSPEGGRKKPGM